MPSTLILSLDFELHWGVFDHVLLDERGRRYFRTTRELIPVLLQRFREAELRCTWATVGFLFAKDKEQLQRLSPTLRPAYADARLDPYRLIQSGEVGGSEADDPYHYAPSLIEKILETPGQELGSHTFSHYYCLEPGQDAEAFGADLSAAQAIARENFGVELQSLVFPRNQFPPPYLDTLAARGFRTYRSNPDIWFWTGAAQHEEGLLKKAARLADHYLPLDRNTSFCRNATAQQARLADVPASRFFRPYLPKVDAYGGQALKLRRILAEMTAAAQQGRHYHLWWHPHNMATDAKRNLEAVDAVIAHFRKLKKKYGMESRGMGEVGLLDG